MWRLFLIFAIVSIARSEYKYETKTFEVPLDHFGYQRNETFKIRYLVNDTYWDQGRGPIFFYTGNEGQIEAFANHTGFMWENAQDYRAKIVFAEHRYYGKSMPFGDKSFEKQNLGYLTSSQALADYADLVNYLQGDSVTPKYSVIAFGGAVRPSRRDLFVRLLLRGRRDHHRVQGQLVSHLEVTRLVDVDC